MKRRLAIPVLLLAAIAALLLLAALATNSDDALERITIGMTEAEVKTILPDGNADGTILLVYEEGRVIAKWRVGGSFFDRLKAWLGI
jgi:hypothetical protein